MLFGCLHQLINDTKENDTVFLVQFFATQKRYDFLSTKCSTGDAYWLPLSGQACGEDQCGCLWTSPLWGKLSSTFWQKVTVISPEKFQASQASPAFFKMRVYFHKSYEIGTCQTFSLQSICRSQEFLGVCVKGYPELPLVSMVSLPLSGNTSFYWVPGTPLRPVSRMPKLDAEI